MIPFSTNNNTNHTYLSGFTTVHLEHDTQLKEALAHLAY